MVRRNSLSLKYLKLCLTFIQVSLMSADSNPRSIATRLLALMTSSLQRHGRPCRRRLPRAALDVIPALIGESLAETAETPSGRARPTKAALRRPSRSSPFPGRSRPCLVVLGDLQPADLAAMDLVRAVGQA